MRHLLCCGFICLLMVSAANAQILFEDFEDGTFAAGYSTSVPDDLSAIANRDYYGRIAPDTAFPPVDVFYNNLQGSGYYGAQDTDSVNISNVDMVILNWTGVDISNFENLNLSWYVAEDTATDGNEDWDITTSVRLDLQVDGGGFSSVFAIESIDAGVGNRAPAVDTNFDGVGDGVAITDIFTQFNVAVANGSMLDIRLTIEDLDTGDEDIAFDNLLLTGDFTGVPEPSFAGLLGLLVAMGWTRRSKVR